MTADKLENLLKTNEIGGLSDIVRRAKELGELTETLSKSLPEDLVSGLVAANIRPGGELVVICQSPAWASRLRFETEALMDAARAAGENVTSCRVRVTHDSGQ